MNLATTAVFYAVLGSAVAVALFLAPDAGRGFERGVRLVTAWLFWPLYLPLLLQPRGRAARLLTAPPHDELSAAIAQVERELAAAWRSLDGWAEEALSREAGRVEELRAAWCAQAARIRELDDLLAQQAPETEGAADMLGERAQRSTAARRENLARLQALRARLYDDLVGTLAWVRELATMIHLAKYSGAPASRAEELVSQIAAAVEGLSEVHGWHDAESVSIR